MRRDSRLSGVLHVLLHLERSGAPVTSEVLAQVMDTNAVVLRRVMAGLRDAGYVQSEKGHGGGWSLTCDFSKVTLREVYAALGAPAMFAMGNRTETPGCVVEEAVNAALNEAFENTEAVLLAHFDKVTLAALSEGVRHRLATRSDAHQHQSGSHEHHVHQSGSHDHAHPGHGTFSDVAAMTTTLDDPARDAWQRPDEVLHTLALEPTMIVADVGAGTGYFAVRLARAVHRGEVIATDLEPEMVRFVSDRARREHLPNLRAVLATDTTSGLAATSVDRILAVHLWHHLAHSDAFAKSLAAALKPRGRLFVVEFGATSQRGPPPNLRVTPEVVIATLEAAGLIAKVTTPALVDHFIVEAHRPIN